MSLNIKEGVHIKERHTNIRGKRLKRMNGNIYTYQPENEITRAEINAYNRSKEKKENLAVKRI